MVRASVTGRIDFTKFDPWDIWWWKRLKWVISDLERENTREVMQLQHRHWVTIATRATLTPESFDAAKTNAAASLNRFIKAVYPWLSETLDANNTETDREKAVSTFHEVFGKPGDPQYELMIDNMLKATKKGPMTAIEKRRDRARRRALRAAETSES